MKKYYKILFMIEVLLSWKCYVIYFENLHYKLLQLPLFNTNNQTGRKGFMLFFDYLSCKFILYLMQFFFFFFEDLYLMHLFLHNIVL